MTIKFHCNNCNVTHTQKHPFQIEIDIVKVLYNEDLAKDYIKYKKLWKKYHSDILDTKIKYENMIEEHNKTARKKKQWFYEKTRFMQSIETNDSKHSIEFKNLTPPQEKLENFDPQYKLYENYFKCPTCSHKYYIG